MSRLLAFSNIIHEAMKLYLRNVHLLKSGFQPPKAITTGTTIAGVIYKDGVILGADTRATEGSIVSDKNCSKIHFLSDNIYCCGAGTAADTEMTTELIASQLRLLNLNTGREIRVGTATNLLKRMLFRYQGYVSAALVLGGVDKIGSYIYTVYPTGCSDKLPYASMGSGSLAAMSIFEEDWRENLSEEEAVKLVRNAITGGILNDLASGSNVDICIIRKGEVKYLCNYEIANVKGVRQLNYSYKAGATAVLDTSVEHFVVVEELVPMEVA